MLKFFLRIFFFFFLERSEKREEIRLRSKGEGKKCSFRD